MERSPGGQAACVFPVSGFPSPSGGGETAACSDHTACVRISHWPAPGVRGDVLHRNGKSRHGCGTLIFLLSLVRDYQFLADSEGARVGNAVGVLKISEGYAKRVGDPQWRVALLDDVDNGSGRQSWCRAWSGSIWSGGGSRARRDGSQRQDGRCGGRRRFRARNDLATTRLGQDRSKSNSTRHEFRLTTDCIHQRRGQVALCGAKDIRIPAVSETCAGRFTGREPPWDRR
jgi:hypothetical protein